MDGGSAAELAAVPVTALPARFEEVESAPGRLCLDRSHCRSCSGPGAKPPGRHPGSPRRATSRSPPPHPTRPPFPHALH
ncbi:hypothetical protein EYF80_049069 [Liparis tanakae]|uniref:Uncharacterized protein n=1 Tax=Liparis tanakae TaxID=230148 RepID=A0A4Z2FIZ8_9TELE|nr:hypothetical protein EYF80_049069 [Liparis tanakae]